MHLSNKFLNVLSSLVIFPLVTIQTNKYNNYIFIFGGSFGTVIYAWLFLIVHCFLLMFLYFRLYFFKCIKHQFSYVAQSVPTICDPMNRSTPGLPGHHHLLEFTQTHVHRVRDAIQPSHPRSAPSLPAPNLSQHQSLFQWVNSSHKVAKVLELQL